MMGAGKTTTGRMVAEELGWDYLDSDVEVEKKTGLTVPALFARDGEAAFRDAEAEVLREACARTDPVVVSVAGGAVLRPENRDLLRASGRVIWLRARPATLAARVGDGVGRPLLGEDPGASLLALDAVRRPLYAEVADETIDVDDLSPTRWAGGSSPASTPGVARDTGDPGRAGLAHLPGPHRAGGPSRVGPRRAVDGQAGLRGHPGNGGEGGVAGGFGPRHALRGLRDARRGGEQDAGHGGGAVSAVRPGRTVPCRRGGRHGGWHRHRCGRVRLGLVPPGDGVREHPHDAAGPGRRRHRREDGSEPAGREEPGRRVLAAPRRPVRYRDPRLTATTRMGLRQGGDGQIRLLGGAAPRRAPISTSRWPAAWRSRPRWSQPTSGKATGG